MNNNEIKLRILYSLYQKFYSGGSTIFFKRDEIIEDAGLKDIEMNLVEGNLVYLINKKMIEGRGRPYPAIIKILVGGIDVLENTITQDILYPNYDRYTR